MSAGHVRPSFAYATCPKGIPLVVLDNGSTDGSYEIISEFLGKGVLFLERLWTEKYEWQLILGKPYELVLKCNPE